MDKHTPEPFGFFRAEPFGWTDCAETDEGAQPLFDQAAIDTLARHRDELLVALKSAVETIEWMHGCTAPAGDEVEKAIREGNAAIAAVEQP